MRFLAILVVLVSAAMVKGQCPSGNCPLLQPPTVTPFVTPAPPFAQPWPGIAPQSQQYFGAGLYAYRGNGYYAPPYSPAALPTYQQPILQMPAANYPGFAGQPGGCNGGMYAGGWYPR